MERITKNKLARWGIQAVLDCQVAGEVTDKMVTAWMSIPVVKNAAMKDAEKHWKWYQVHGDMDDCEIPHNHTFKAIQRFLPVD